MPITLPTTYGATDYTVVLALKNLGAAVNAIEPRVASIATAADIAAVRSDLATMKAQIATLMQQVRGLLTP